VSRSGENFLKNNSTHRVLKVAVSNCEPSEAIQLPPNPSRRWVYSAKAGRNYRFAAIGNERPDVEAGFSS
jgi:hypothetical protein